MTSNFATENAPSRSAPPPPIVDENVSRKVGVAALIGTALEWYDFLLFTTAAALIFNVQFFHSDDPLLATIYSFATIAVGFVVRPIGGVVCGMLGDKYGRKVVLMGTIVGIGVVTGLIGFLPNYASIGIAAPAILITLRLLQGFAVGGEWSGAVVLAVEHAPVEKRARYAALPQIGSPIGTLLSSGGFFAMSFLLSKEDFEGWGWRVPFLAAIPLLFVALWLRSKLSESPEFERLMEEGETESTPVRTVLVDYWRQTLTGMASTLVGVAGFYILTTFVIYYGTAILELSRSLMLMATLVAAAVEIPVLVWGGRLAEKYGAGKVIRWGSLASAVAAFPVFLAIQTGKPVLIVVAVTVGVSCVAVPYAASGTALSGLFPARTRYTGVALSSNAASILSGFVPMIATALLAIGDNSIIPIAVLFIALALTTAAAGAVLPKLGITQQGIRH